MGGDDDNGTWSSLVIPVVLCTGHLFHQSRPRLLLARYLTVLTGNQAPLMESVILWQIWTLGIVFLHQFLQDFRIDFTTNVIIVLETPVNTFLLQAVFASDHFSLQCSICVGCVCGAVAGYDERVSFCGTYNRSGHKQNINLLGIFAFWGLWVSTLIR